MPVFPIQPTIETFLLYDVGTVWGIGANIAAVGILNSGM